MFLSSMKIEMNTIKALSKIVLVGSSGAGKNTLAKPILRFCDIDSGSIKIGGIGIRVLIYEELMKHLFCVSRPISI